MYKKQRIYFLFLGQMFSYFLKNFNDIVLINQELLVCWARKKYSTSTVIKILPLLMLLSQGFAAALS